MVYGCRLIPVKAIVYSCRRYVRSGIDYSKNYYEILEVKRDATQQEIKNAFYTLSKKYHPDVTGSAPGSALTGRFIAIKEAYDVLKDVDSRRDYDSHRAQTISDYARQTYRSQTYSNPGYGNWRSNRYAGSRSSSGQYRNTWPYSEDHLRRVFEEMRRRAEEYERVRREQDELYWERVFRAERERNQRRRRHEMPPRLNIKLAMESWLSGPLLPYLPYLSAALIIYMFGFFFYTLFTVISERKVPIGVEKDDDGDEENREKMQFDEMVARERLIHDMNSTSIANPITDVMNRQITDMINVPPTAH